MGKETSVSKTREKKTLYAAYKGYKDGSVDFLGDQVLALTGYAREEFNSKRLKWIDIIWREDRAACRTSFIQGLKTDMTYLRTYRIHTREGGWRWLQEWGQIVPDEGGEVEYVTGILMDITSQKEEEAARERCERKTGKYLLFTLAGQTFGLGIAQVKEIVPRMEITEMPQAPGYVRGVINLRGKVIPVMDLRQKFFLADGAMGDQGCIIIVEGACGDRERQIGIQVDAVQEVLFLMGNDIEEPPVYFSGMEIDYIFGLAKVEGEIKILLDMAKVFGEEEETGLPGKLEDGAGEVAAGCLG